jgi:hypothetical protein
MVLFPWWLAVPITLLGILVLFYVVAADYVLDHIYDEPYLGACCFRVPTRWPWSLWPDSRSMTLLLPLLGIVIFWHWKDLPSKITENEWRVKIAHEWLGHRAQLEADGYLFYLRYFLSKRWRFIYERDAFRFSVMTAVRFNMTFKLPDRVNPVFPPFYFGRHLSEDYRLGPGYDFRTCYDALSGQGQ